MSLDRSNPDLSDYYRELDRAEELKKTFVVPADDDRGTYTGRHLEIGYVSGKEETLRQDGHYVTISTGGTAWMPSEVSSLLEIGDPYAIELRQGSLVMGWVVNGQWHKRKTDEELAEENRKYLAAEEQRKKDRHIAERAANAEHEASLPQWIATRLRTFRERAGERFEIEGWGYELAVADLAVLYARMDEEALNPPQGERVQDSVEVGEYARREGTSGNQHSVAILLARAHQAGHDLAGTVSALSPLTGEPFYEKRARG